MDDIGSRHGVEVLDLRGTGCADVLIRLAAIARRGASMRDVLVRTDDAGAPEELPAWCRMTGHRFHALVADTTDTYHLTLHPNLRASPQPTKESS